MELLLFQTDIKSKEKVNFLTLLFNQQLDILKWSVDLEDIDHVLRVEANSSLSESDVIEMLQPYGFYIEVLRD